MNQEHLRTTEQETALKDWIASQDTEGFLFLTLTLKQSITVLTDRGRTTIPTDWISASRSFRHFMNRLNQKTLRADYRKGRRRLKVIPFLEEKNGNLHYHCAIENPLFHETAFKHRLFYCWRKSPLGNINNHGRVCEDDDWTAYCLKRQTNNWNTLDWNNLSL